MFVLKSVQDTAYQVNKFILHVHSVFILRKCREAISPKRLIHDEMFEILILSYLYASICNIFRRKIKR